VKLFSFTFDSARLDVLLPVLSLPSWKKVVMLSAAFLLPLIAYIFFDWLPLEDDIGRIQRQVDQQQVIYRKNLQLTRYLPEKKKEFAGLNKQLKVALNMLPRQFQIPDLVEGISRAGRNSGLEFTVFKPAPEERKQFYAEVPVNFVVTGTYRQLLTFLRRVGEIPRIVDVKRLSIRRHGQDGPLEVTGQAVTYRLVEENEKQKNRGGRKR